MFISLTSFESRRFFGRVSWFLTLGKVASPRPRTLSVRATHWVGDGKWGRHGQGQTRREQIICACRNSTQHISLHAPLKSRVRTPRAVHGSIATRESGVDIHTSTRPGRYIVGKALCGRGRIGAQQGFTTDPLSPQTDLHTQRCCPCDPCMSTRRYP